MSRLCALRGPSWPALLALLSVLAQTTAALADYGARQIEAKDRLDDTEMPAEERDALDDALDYYFDARDRCLDDLVDLVKENDEGEQARAYVQRSGECATEGTEHFDDALDDFDPPSMAALGFVNVFQAREGAFMGALGGLVVAGSRDRIVQTRVVIHAKKETLEAKWAHITETDDSIDARAARETEAIRDLLRRTIRSAADANKDITEALRAHVKRVAGAPISTGDETLDDIKDAIATALTAWETMDTRVTDRANAYESLFNSEVRVLVMFTEVREDVQEFLDESGYPRAADAHAAAEASLASFVGGAATSGQEEDADDFRDRTMSALTAHLDDTRDIYEDFVSAHESKFFGALGPDVRAEILEPDAWRSQIEGIRSFSLDNQVREWQRLATNYFEVDLSGLSSERRRDLKNGLRGIIDELVREMKAAGRSYRDVLATAEAGREDVGAALD